MLKTASILETAIILIEIYFIQKKRKNTREKIVKLSIPNATHRQAILLGVVVTARIAIIVAQVAHPSDTNIIL